MSATTAVRRPTKKVVTPAARATKAAKATKPRLRVVDNKAIRRRRRQRTLLSFAAAVVTVALFGVALMYGQLVEGQQNIDQLRAEIAKGHADRARLEREVAVASTPEAIVQRAFELGMVRALNPQYLVAVRPVGPDQ